MRKHLQLFLLIMAAFFCSCNTEGEIFNDLRKPDYEEVMTRSTGISGYDPYKLEVMQTSLDMLVQSNPDLDPITLRPTDHYVKFYPKDTVQVDILCERNIELFAYPLDVELTPEQIDEYYDIYYNEFEWVYSVVPDDFDFPEEIEYEIIHDAFIQRQKTSASPSGQLPTNVYDMVEDIAFELTGHGSVTRTDTKWTPSALVTYQVRNVNVPLQGVKVRMYIGSNIISVYTDVNGIADAIGTTTHAVYYDISWSYNQYWEIRKGKTGTIYSSSATPDALRERHHFEITEGLPLAAGAVHRALHAYYLETHELTKGLVKYGKINVALRDEYNSSYNGSFIPFRRNKIHILTKYSTGRYIEPAAISSTTFHELGHASHYKLRSGSFIGDYVSFSKNRFSESWANGVEYAYMRSLYPTHTGSSKGKPETYTRLVESLMNQGLTLLEIQTAFARHNTWVEWRDEIKKILDPDITHLIFGHPNDYFVNLTDPEAVIEGPEYFFIGEEVNFRIPENGIPDSVEVLEWSIDGDGSNMLTSDESTCALHFDTRGRRNISAKVKLANLEKTYTRSVMAFGFTYPQDIAANSRFTVSAPFISPSNENINLNILDWRVVEGGNGHIQPNTDGKSASFLFAESGPKIIAVDYVLNGRESTTNIHLNVGTSSTILLFDEIKPYKANTDYKIYYFLPDNAKFIKFSIYYATYRIYLYPEFTHNPVERSFTFQFPTDGGWFPICYFARIWYEDKYGRERTEVILMSNYDYNYRN